ncbi:glycosyltransferase family 4 protein [Epibacterium ulvae]|uniref:glycosyltransferase family 4 protein n=1 Tax=Epibacterium ulvae TaxID=1156985 RepID=UPI002490A18D|nr:glycosyltransferase family 1 protein [Epibacterium ulvae]
MVQNTVLETVLPPSPTQAPAADEAGPLSLAINGRFLTRPMTGVDRVASELTKALNADKVANSIRFLMPQEPKALPENMASALSDCTFTEAPRSTGHLWEQYTMPRMASQQEWLLNLCNTGPITHKRQACMIHDAQFITQAESYSWKFRTLYRALMPRLAAQADVLLTVSEFSRLELEKLGVFPKDKAIVVHNGCDHMDHIQAAPDALAQYNLELNGYFMVLGSRAAHKNLEMVLQVANESDLDIPIAVVGGGSKDVFKSIGITDSPRIKILGRVEDEALKTLLAGARALLFPSKTEGFGLPPLEAMRCGCPVVATTGGAVPEVCGGAPIYADPDKPQAWAEAMRHLLDTPEALDELRQKGTARAAQFTWAAAAKRITDTLRAADMARP